MTFPFNPAQSLIVVGATITGPVRDAALLLALDTGASGVFIDPGILTRIGYDLTGLPPSVNVNTAIGLVKVPQLQVAVLDCLGVTVTNFRVVAHRVQKAGIDGLIGLEFLRGHVLNIDFVKGEITLTAPGPTP